MKHTCYQTTRQGSEFKITEEKHQVTNPIYCVQTYFDFIGIASVYFLHYQSTVDAIAGIVARWRVKEKQLNNLV